MVSLQLPLPKINNRIFLHFNPKPASFFSRVRNCSRAFPCKKKSIFASWTAADAIFGGEEETTTTTAEEEWSLPSELRPELMPKHVAVIMDGNGRWARQRNLPTSFGHKAGLRALTDLIDLSCKWGIRVLTVFAFSTENWLRPKLEVDIFMNLFECVLKEELKKLMRQDVRISVIGDSKKLPKSLQKLKTEVEDTTRNNSGLQLIFALSYTGQYDIVEACKSIAEKTKDGMIQPNDITEAVIEQELETNCTKFPHPDLLIRTSGEQRISNFLLWQLAYTELAFVKSLWPDFGKADFVDVLCSFQQRQRRYGGRDS
ncbi:hypothetical protein NE237_004004 [Protea cynaroides]|uniref:Alkyl transferase n=1 Tax=Protea cynaroides TaxID=273540 RepID=A0A9Q0QT53_9MAGN|nr:hypothetical protein NE237_004004 [Protea cynaroides]